MKRCCVRKRRQSLFVAVMLISMLSFDGIMSGTYAQGKVGAAENTIKEVTGNPRYHCTLDEDRMRYRPLFRRRLP